MKVFYTRHFLSARYFDYSHSRDKYDCEDTKQIKNTYFSKIMNKYVKKINILLKFFVFFMPSTYRRKNDENLFLFGIVNLFDIYQMVSKTDSKHISVWLWNPVKMTFSKRVVFLYLRLLNANVITFDKSDADKYNFTFHPQVYAPEILEQFKAEEQQYDLFFVGADKHRYDGLALFAKVLKKENISFNFHIVADKSSVDRDAEYISNSYVSYDDYLNILMKSSCLLDYTQEKQTGLTVRVLEAIFAGKKVITNNHSIIEYDLYCPENVFILGVDAECHLKQFIKTPFKAYKQGVLDQYNLASLLAIGANYKG